VLIAFVLVTAAFSFGFTSFCSQPIRCSVLIKYDCQKPSNMSISHLRTNHLVNPIGYLFSPPSISWITESTTSSKQLYAQVIVHQGRPITASSTPIFDSGQTQNISSLGYELPISLQPYTRYYWRVKVWADDSCEIESDWAFFETGKLNDTWKASWIRSSLAKEDHPLLRKEFTVSKTIESARVYVCGLGLYELYLNGMKVGDEYLMPGYHSYDFFLQYQTYDIHPLLKKGGNCVGAVLGVGWYKGTFCHRNNGYGDTMQLICEIRIWFEDKTELIIGSDSDWKCHVSAIIASGIYYGE
jgi:alpha-L-rhamnosidase